MSFVNIFRFEKLNIVEQKALIFLNDSFCLQKYNLYKYVYTCKKMTPYLFPKSLDAEKHL